MDPMEHVLSRYEEDDLERQNAVARERRLNTPADPTDPAELLMEYHKCAWCNNEYYEFQNIGKLSCHVHPGMISPETGRWTCCDRDATDQYACTPAAHFPFMQQNMGMKQHLCFYVVPMSKQGNEPGMVTIDPKWEVPSNLDEVMRKGGAPKKLSIVTAEGVNARPQVMFPPSTGSRWSTEVHRRVYQHPDKTRTITGILKPLDLAELYKNAPLLRVPERLRKERQQQQALQAEMAIASQIHLDIGDDLARYETAFESSIIVYRIAPIIDDQRDRSFALDVLPYRKDYTH